MGDSILSSRPAESPPQQAVAQLLGQMRGCCDRLETFFTELFDHLDGIAARAEQAARPLDAGPAAQAPAGAPLGAELERFGEVLDWIKKRLEESR
jgi:hypothetical protein